MAARFKNEPEDDAARPDRPLHISSPLTAEPSLFGQIVESCPNGVLMVDPEARIALVNREAERMFGYTRVELIGQPIEMLVPARFRAQDGGYRRSFIDAPQSRGMGTGRDLFGLRRDGTEIPIEIGFNPIQTAKGTFVLASVVDITARRRAETRFRVAVEASPHGMLMIDPSGNIVLVNREIERLFEYNREELLGQPVEILVPTDVREHHPELRDSFHRSPKSRPMGGGRDLYGRRKDGAQIPVEIALNPIETDEGMFVLASVVDIAPRKKAEEELRRSNEELERFAYVASHDLQEPLRTVTSYVQLLERRYRDQLGGDAAEFIDFAVAGATRMQHLIQDLLAFSRVGRYQPEVKAIDSGAVFQATLDDLRAALSTAVATVTRDPLPHVMADPVELEQLFTNLVSNALKFRRTTPRLHVGARRDGRFWEFAVRDNGIGVEAKYFDRIFVIFHRLHARDRYEGTGVGLAICKKIVERHGGRIWIESTVGEGSTFRFTLPAVLD